MDPRDRARSLEHALGGSSKDPLHEQPILRPRCQRGAVDEDVACTERRKFLEIGDGIIDVVQTAADQYEIDGPARLPEVRNEGELSVLEMSATGCGHRFSFTDDPIEASFRKEILDSEIVVSEGAPEVEDPNGCVCIR